VSTAPFSSETPRIFLAAPFPDDFKREAARLQDSLKRVFRTGVHWIPPANFHLTLKFFGETKPVKLEKVLRRLAEILADAPSCDVQFGDFGYFGSPRSPRVLFLHGESPALVAIAERVLAVFPDERPRPFRAHLTVGKFQKRRTREEVEQAAELIAKWSDAGSQALSLPPVNLTARITELVLMETIWVGRVVEYEARVRYPPEK